MRGWEVTARLWEFDKSADRYDGSWAPHIDKIMDALVDDGGINRVRIQVQSGIENPIDYWQQFVTGAIGYEAFKAHFYETFNDNDDPFSMNQDGVHFTSLNDQVETVLLPMKQRLEARGEKLFVTLTFVDFKWTQLRGDIALALHPAEYSELIVESFQHLQNKYGVVPDALEIILEPDNTDHWRGRQIAQAALAVKPRLAAEGFYPRLIGPSTAQARRTMRFFDEMQGTSNIRGLFDTLSYHRYDKNASQVLSAITEAARVNGLETAMLEYTRGSVDHLFDDLLIGEVSAWQQYGVARKIVDGVPSATNSYFLEVTVDGEQAQVALSRRARFLAPVFRVFRMGGVRVRSTSDVTWIRSVAVRNTDDSLALAMRLSRGGRFSVSGLPEGRYRVEATLANQERPTVIEVEVAGKVPLDLEAHDSGVVTVRSLL
ncbi:carboxypeptidase-like regulatory domain-containing protein [Pseudohalocynthiibacter sp. F2068]|nr:carboxypeptidase-like regulatory domain-containing protein [Pseudohalocynthiibacter sp. F2068]